MTSVNYSGTRGQDAWTMPFAVTARAVGRVIEAAKVKVRERSTVRAVSGLDDHILKDIGVPRSEIAYRARVVAERSGTDHRSFAR